MVERPSHAGKFSDFSPCPPHGMFAAMPAHRALVRAAAMLALMLVAPTARAQAPAAPSVPVAVDLRKVPLGSWSEYALTMGSMPAMRQRFALVGRTDKIHELELAME